jgi:hypothetical protein
VMTSADWVEGGERVRAGKWHGAAGRAHAMRSKTTMTVHVFGDGDGDVVKDEED